MLVYVVGGIYRARLAPGAAGQHFLKVDEHVGLLAEYATALSEPYARHLGDGVRELRPTLDGTDMRIMCWLTPARTAVLLTVFRKTRMREDAEVERAKRAQKLCEAEHEPAHEKALDATLNIALDDADTYVTFTAHRHDAA
ncbi:type II toxin-antitoxin system RelE/ParE family toxin [Streptomyces sp. NPDC054796]